ncbi:MAG: hypothetical protein COT71_00560 [Candidatus Andersenbacteria bacterium CG10_big_fil_rev_8_21_14_0_10_54_11]|uniref:Uncharacterized protein n=1 Tax=Candidatus Andersenbacteria bacterium CG10_big_fil_rev_8_21_14_0_10_54_11 TaxID=1974485 RepID=A0A2M6X066_9BACT|nr:MAG: hypothetical protein COT71_00560 [Candidatus Andersenbacteria bacterium CG10_big_fil_rev_8_21_14_0_10_54_11]
MKTVTDNRGNRNRIPVGQFVPRSWEEQVLKDVAIKLKEPHIDFIKSISDRVGIEVIREACQEYDRAIKAGVEIEKTPGAYFNGIVKKILARKGMTYQNLTRKRR